MTPQYISIRILGKPELNKPLFSKIVKLRSRSIPGDFQSIQIQSVQSFCLEQGCGPNFLRCVGGPFFKFAFLKKIIFWWDLIFLEEIYFLKLVNFYFFEYIGICPFHQCQAQIEI